MPQKGSGPAEQSCLSKGFLGGAPLSGLILARSNYKVTIASSGGSFGFAVT